MHKAEEHNVWCKYWSKLWHKPAPCCVAVSIIFSYDCIPYLEFLLIHMIQGIHYCFTVMLNQTTVQLGLEMVTVRILKLFKSTARSHVGCVSEVCCVFIRYPMETTEESKVLYSEFPTDDTIPQTIYDFLLLFDLDEPPVAVDRCSDPGTPRNAQRQVSDESFRSGTTLDFVCEAGFLLQGRATITCISGGQWDSQLPDCIADTCLWVLFNLSLLPNLYVWQNEYIKIYFL